MSPSDTQCMLMQSTSKMDTNILQLAFALQLVAYKSMPANKCFVRSDRVSKSIESEKRENCEIAEKCEKNLT